MTIAAPGIVLALAACAAFAVRKRLVDVASLSLAALAIAILLLLATPAGATGQVLDLELRMSPLARLAGPVLLGIIGLLIVGVLIAEPAYNFFPTALAVGSVSIGVLVVVSPFAIC